LANHRQNVRDDSIDDSFDEDSPHELVLPLPRTLGPRLPYDIHGLPYHYEPYDILEGWNYTEKYTPAPGRRNYSDSRYKELQERRDEIEGMIPELKLHELVERLDEIERMVQELEGNAGVTDTKNL
jgi:hypothetical protein